MSILFMLTAGSLIILLDCGILEGDKYKINMSRHHLSHHHHFKKKHTKAKKSAKKPIDYFVYFFMFLSPLFEIPQAVNIYTQKSAHTVSLTTWVLFFLASIAWLIYGVRNQLKSIMAIQILYMIIEASVVIGILRYS